MRASKRCASARTTVPLRSSLAIWTTYGARADTQHGSRRGCTPSLVSAEAQAVIDAVRGPDVLGWKVNGAGGAGGSITVLAASAEARARLAVAHRPAMPWATLLDVRLATTGVAQLES